MSPRRDLPDPGLTPAQEASAIFRRKAIYEELHPETKATYAGGAFKGNQHSAVTDNLSITNFASATADATGRGVLRFRRSFPSRQTRLPLRRA